MKKVIEIIGSVIYVLVLLALPVYFVFFNEPQLQINGALDLIKAILLLLAYIVGCWFAITPVYWLLMTPFITDGEFRKDLIGCLLPFYAIIALLVCALIYKGCDGDSEVKNTFYEKKPQEIDSVYICISERAYAFHVRFSCSALQNCNYRIEKVSVETANNIGRIPCGICSKNVRLIKPQEKSNYETPWEVYICPDPKSHAYHYDRDCSVLIHCIEDQQPIIVTYEEAKEHQRTPCYKCARKLIPSFFLQVSNFMRTFAK